MTSDIRTMRSKNISTQSNELLTHFNGIEKPCFKSSDAFEILSKSSKPTVNQILSDRTKRGLLIRIKDGVYYIIPYEKVPESFMPDGHLLTENLVN
jgi:predicted transcriptional regulator of viral defense system